MKVLQWSLLLIHDVYFITRLQAVLLTVPGRQYNGKVSQACTKVLLRH